MNLSTQPGETCHTLAPTQLSDPLESFSSYLVFYIP